MPAYNSSRYIGAAVASILGQTESRIEVIVVDDGSTDTTPQIVQRFSDEDRRVQLVRRSEPSGRPAVPRNRGIALAKGKYIAFQDADDISLPTRFADTIRAMEIGGATMAFADMLRFDDVTGTRDSQTRLGRAAFLSRAANYLERVTDTIYRCKPNFIGFMLSEMAAANTQTCIFERSLLDDETTWFDEARLCAEDTDLFYRLASKARVVFLNEIEALYRVHANSLTAGLPERTVRDGIEVRRENLARFEHLLSKADIRATKAHNARALLEIAYSQWCVGNLRAARAASIESWATRPSRAAASGFAKALVSREAMHSVVRPVFAIAAAFRRRQGRSLVDSEAHIEQNAAENGETPVVPIEPSADARRHWPAED
jgi:glycosyltransferase involved in cell wall biosynthesis